MDFSSPLFFSDTSPAQLHALSSLFHRMIHRLLLVWSSRMLTGPFGLTLSNDHVVSGREHFQSLPHRLPLIVFLPPLSWVSWGWAQMLPLGLSTPQSLILGTLTSHESHINCCPLQSEASLARAESSSSLWV